MKKTEIKIGHVYTNGRGRTRKIIDMGPQYKYYPEQESEENVRYEILCDGSKKNATRGQQCNMTLASFASWAKEDVTDAVG